MKKLLILSLLLTITCLQSKAQDGHFFKEGYKLCLTDKIRVIKITKLFFKIDLIQGIHKYGIK